MWLQGELELKIRDNIFTCYLPIAVGQELNMAIIAKKSSMSLRVGYPIHMVSLIPSQKKSNYFDTFFFSIYLFSCCLCFFFYFYFSSIKIQGSENCLQTVDILSYVCGDVQLVSTLLEVWHLPQLRSENLLLRVSQTLLKTICQVTLLVVSHNRFISYLFISYIVIQLVM